MGAKVILQEGMIGMIMEEEWFRASPTATGGVRLDLSKWGAFKGGRYRPDFQNLGQNMRRETADATA